MCTPTDSKLDVSRRYFCRSGSQLSSTCETLSCLSNFIPVCCACMQCRLWEGCLRREWLKIVRAQSREPFAASTRVREAKNCGCFSGIASPATLTSFHPICFSEPCWISVSILLRLLLASIPLGLNEIKCAQVYLDSPNQHVLQIGTPTTNGIRYLVPSYVGSSCQLQKPACPRNNVKHARACDLAWSS